MTDILGLIYAGAVAFGGIMGYVKAGYLFISSFKFVLNFSLKKYPRVTLKFFFR